MNSLQELWREAGGGTPEFSRERYRELLIEHGHLVPLAPGETAGSLPCDRRSVEDERGWRSIIEARTNTEADCPGRWHFYPTADEGGPTGPCPDCGARVTTSA